MKNTEHDLVDVEAPAAVNFEGDDIERMALLALALAILNQVAMDLAHMQLRTEFVIRRKRLAATEAAERSKAMTFKIDVMRADVFLRGPDAQIVCDVVGSASLGKVRLTPEWILRVQVPELKRRHARSRKAAVTRWEGRPPR